MKWIIISCFTFNSILLLPTEASTLLVKNCEENTIEVIIQPDDENALSAQETPYDGPELKFIIEGQGQRVFDLRREFLSQRATTFAVVGKSALYSLSQRCSGLKIDENYEIMLTARRGGGISCAYRKLK